MKFSKILIAVHINAVDIAHKDLFHPRNFNCHSTFHIFWTGADSQIMKEFSLMNLKRFIIYFVGNCCFFWFSEHSLSGLHVVLHNIFEMWHTIVIHDVEVNILASGYTELLGSIELINVALASIFELIVDFPGMPLKNFIENQLEKYDLVGALSQ